MLLDKFGLPGRLQRLHGGPSGLFSLSDLTTSVMLSTHTYWPTTTLARYAPHLQCHHYANKRQDQRAIVLLARLLTTQIAKPECPRRQPVFSACRMITPITTDQQHLTAVRITDAADRTDF